MGKALGGIFFPAYLTAWKVCDIVYLVAEVKSVSKESTEGRYITESRRWWESVWDAFGNGFVRCRLKGDE